MKHFRLTSALILSGFLGGGSMALADTDPALPCHSSYDEGTDILELPCVELTPSEIYGRATLKSVSPKEDGGPFTFELVGWRPDSKGNMVFGDSLGAWDPALPIGANGTTSGPPITYAFDNCAKLGNDTGTLPIADLGLLEKALVADPYAKLCPDVSASRYPKANNIVVGGLGTRAERDQLCADPNSGCVKNAVFEGDNWGPTCVGWDLDSVDDTYYKIFAEDLKTYASTEGVKGTVTKYCPDITASIAHESHFAVDARSWDSCAASGNGGAVGMFQYDFRSLIPKLPVTVQAQFNQFLNANIGKEYPNIADGIASNVGLTAHWDSCRARAKGATVFTDAEFGLAIAACNEVFGTVYTEDSYKKIGVCTTSGGHGGGGGGDSYCTLASNPGGWDASTCTKCGAGDDSRGCAGAPIVNQGVATGGTLGTSGNICVPASDVGPNTNASCTFK